MALFKAAALPAAKFTTLRLEAGLAELEPELSAAFAVTLLLAMVVAAATVAII